ncbi:unnamed protein product [Arabidopsis halleri]
MTSTTPRRLQIRWCDKSMLGILNHPLHLSREGYLLG